MNRRDRNKIWAVLSACFLILAFQNCSKGFQILSSQEGLMADVLNSQILMPPPNTNSNGSIESPDLEAPPVSALPQPKPGEYETFPFQSPFALVYVRIPRATETMKYTHSDGVVYPAAKNWDVMQMLPETSHRIAGMSGPGQLIYRSRTGDEKVLYDCMVTADCLPMDPTVSFDGRKVIFSVLWGTISKAYANGQTFPYTILGKPREAKLFIVDIETGALTALPHTPGTFDTGPVFLPDGNIMFTSTRSNEMGTSHFYYTPSTEKVLQLWLADGSGNNARRVGPHDRDGVLHPFVMPDGQVLLSTWQLSHLQAHISNNGAVGAPSAEDNKFWLASLDHSGGNWNAVLGNHGEYYMQGGSMKSMKALHFVTETTNRWLCTTDYYRANNFGSGQIVCWEKEATGIEGRGPAETKSINFIFTPRKIMGIALWAGSQDNVASRVDGKYTGKVRDPMALPGNQLLLTFMKGPCSQVQGRDTVMKIQNEPIGCDGGIYRTTRIPSQSTNDLVAIVDRPEWHEFMGRVAEPYKFVYGLDQPPVPNLQRDVKNRCILASSSMESEVTSVAGYDFFSARDCAIFGCRTREIPVAKVKAIRFWKVHPNVDETIQKNKLRSNTGHVHELLGDVPLNPDGSFAAELPCDTPYVMAGVDDDGNTLMRDQVPQSLRTGEVRTCTGCHLHSKPGRPIEQSLAAQQLANPFKVGMGNFPTMQKGTLVPETTNVPAVVEYTKDIYPILQNRCFQCHSGATAAKGLRLDVPGTALYSAKSSPETATAYFRLVRDFQQILVQDRISYAPDDPDLFSLEKPYTSKYTNSAFAVESLLLWKVVNRRMDGRTDASYARDIDFGPSHPTSVTDDEIRMIRDWIDAGSYGAH